MSDLDRTKLAQLLGMSGSAHDGEALNAVRAANRALRAAGKTWKDVLTQAEAKRFTEQEVQAAMRRAYESGYADGRPRPQPAPQPDPEPVDADGLGYALGRAFAFVFRWRRPQVRNLSPWERAVCLLKASIATPVIGLLLIFALALIVKTIEEFPTTLTPVHIDHVGVITLPLSHAKL